MSRERVLITGGTGFIGRHVAADMHARGYEVIVTGREGGTALPRDVRRLTVDLLSDSAPAAIAEVGAGTLIHLAWETTHGIFWNAPENLDWSAATFRIARAFQAAGGARLVGVGTGFEYALSGIEPLDEASSPLKPATFYGASKNVTRLGLEAFAEATQLSFAWARVFHLFGPGEKPTRLVPAVIGALMRGEEAKTTKGDLPRNFMHARDVGRAIATVAAAPVTGAINIGHERHTCVAEIACEIARQLGKEALLRIGAVPTNPAEPASIIPRLDRLAALGFKPELDLASGLAEVIQSMKKAGGTTCD